MLLKQKRFTDHLLIGICYLQAVEVVEALAAEDDKDAGDKKTRSQQLSCSKCSFVAKRHPDLVSCCILCQPNNTVPLL